MVPTPTDMINTMKTNTTCSEMPTAACEIEPSLPATWQSTMLTIELLVVINNSGQDIIQIARQRLPSTKGALFDFELSTLWSTVISDMTTA